MLKRLQAALEWLLAPEISNDRRPGHLWPRWIFLRALGLIYFSAFYSLLFQIKGLIGPNGILPARDYLQAVAAALQAQRFWYAPTLLWFGSSDRALMLICWVGAIASLLLVLNIWPRAMLAICFVCFLSFIGAAQDFASYQSDGMLLEAGFLCLFFAPDGFRPGLGRASPPSRASLYPLALGVVLHLFRIGRGQDGQRRSHLAEFHRHGRLLPELPAPHLDRLVRGPFSALVPCLRRVLHAGHRTRAGMDDFSPPAISHRAFLHRGAVRNQHHSHRQLRLPELHRFFARLSSARRPLHRMDRPAQNP